MGAGPTRGSSRTGLAQVLPCCYPEQQREHLEFALGHLHCIFAGDKSVAGDFAGWSGLAVFTLSFPNVCMRSRLCIKRASHNNTYNVFRNAMRISSLVGLPVPPALAV